MLTPHVVVSLGSQKGSEDRSEATATGRWGGTWDNAGDQLLKAGRGTKNESPRGTRQRLNPEGDVAADG